MILKHSTVYDYLRTFKSVDNQAVKFEPVQFNSFVKVRKVKAELDPEYKVVVPFTQDELARFACSGSHIANEGHD